jgi:hypothetical protein
MFLDDESPIAGGRELWGFPKKLASPSSQGPLKDPRNRSSVAGLPKRLLLCRALSRIIAPEAIEAAMIGSSRMHTGQNEGDGITLRGRRVPKRNSLAVMPLCQRHRASLAG